MCYLNESLPEIALPALSAAREIDERIPACPSFLGLRSERQRASPSLAQHPELSTAAFLICATKQDLPGCASQSDLSTAMQLDELMETRQWRIMGTSMSGSPFFCKTSRIIATKLNLRCTEKGESDHNEKSTP
jgi:hypothetical protein